MLPSPAHQPQASEHCPFDTPAGCLTHLESIHLKVLYPHCDALTLHAFSTPGGHGQSNSFRPTMAYGYLGLGEEWRG